jgi:hypothetical protein
MHELFPLFASLSYHFPSRLSYAHQSQNRFSSPSDALALLGTFSNNSGLSSVTMEPIKLNCTTLKNTCTLDFLTSRLKQLRRV